MNARTTVTLIALGVASLSVASDGSAFAAPPQLKGTYAVTGETVCLVAPLRSGGIDRPQPFGFNTTTLRPNQIPNPNPALPPLTAFTSVLTLSFHGIRIFNGDGTGTVKGRAVSISSSPSSFPNSFIPGANVADSEGQFTYEVAADGTVEIENVPNTFFSAFLDALGAPTQPQRFSTNTGFSLKGRVSVNKQTLTAATDLPEIEEVRFFNGTPTPNPSNPDAATDIQQRICHRTRVMTWMNGQSDDD